jgi:hypothetical protein
VTRRGTGRERPGRKLDDEGPSQGEGTALPARRSAGWNGEPPEGETDEPRVSAGSHRVSVVPRAHVGLGLVKPNGQSRLDPEDEAPGKATLRLRQRLWAGVSEIPALSKRAPAGREVAVEVDTARVLAHAEAEAVRVEVVDDPDVRIRGDRAVRQQAGHSGAGALVPVDAADDEHSAGAVGVAELERMDRAAAHRVAEQLATLDRGRGESKADESFDHHDGSTGP